MIILNYKNNARHAYIHCGATLSPPQLQGPNTNTHAYTRTQGALDDNKMYCWL